MLFDHVVLTSETKDRKGAIYSKKTIPEEAKDKWIVRAKLQFGNEAQTQKGGAGAAIHYLDGVNKEEIGNGLFGYSKQYKGIGVYFNTYLQSVEDNKALNYI